MPDRIPPIARIRLSRSLGRLLALPLLALVAGAGAIAAGLLMLPGIVGLAVAALGGLVVVVGLVGAVLLLSVHLDVEEAAICLAWLGGERIYPLSPGPVTRVRLRGENESSLRATSGGLGWQLGGAVLREEERIEVVRLARTPTAILVPTERGRLAIAAADEEALLEALSRAARARQRLEDLAREVPPAAEEQPTPQIVVDAAVMTGIERALHERRMAEDRAAAAERVGAETNAAAGADADVAPAVAEAEPRPRRLRVPRWRGAPGPGPSLALLLLPLVGAGAAWGIALLQDRMPDPASDLGRLTALGLVLAGPATTVGAIMARVWWPRLVAVVVAGGLASAVFIGRSLLG